MNAMTTIAAATSNHTHTCCTCKKTLTAKEIQFWLSCDGGKGYLADDDVDCFFCQEADTFFETQSLAYAETGGGQEMVNDLSAERE